MEVYENFQFEQTNDYNNNSDSDLDNIIEKHIIDNTTKKSINDAINDYIDIGFSNLSYVLKFSECNYAENIFKLKKINYVLIKIKYHNNLSIYYVKKNNNRYTVAINFLTNKVQTINKTCE